jgi:hypothetical protein
VVAYDKACAHQYVRMGHTGWLADLGQLTQFSEIIKMLPARETLKTMGIQAQVDVQHVGWKHPVQQFEQALYSVARRSIAPS